MDKIEAAVNVITVLINTHPYLFAVMAVSIVAIWASCKYVISPMVAAWANARYVKPRIKF